MRTKSLITAMAVSIPTTRALCPSLHMPKDIIGLAVEYETIHRNSLIPRSKLEIGVYIHNIASGPTWDEGCVSVSPPPNPLSKRTLPHQYT